MGAKVHIFLIMLSFEKNETRNFDPFAN